MGEFTNGVSPEQIAASDKEVKTDSGEDNKGFETDVADLYADGEKQGMPVFDVNKTEFFQNMSHGRKRLRFKQGSTAQKYMQKTKYQSSFWISYDDNGKKWTRKIK
jgi:hypothetical protein